MFLCYSDNCKNKTLCMEKLSLVLPETPPYLPRQFDRCAVIGNSGDLLKTRFGKEIDSYDAVIRENGAPIEVLLPLNQILVTKLLSSIYEYSLIFSFLIYCRTIQTMWARKVRSVFSIEDLQKLLIKW